MTFKADNESGSIIAIITVMLAVIFAGAAYLWLTLPITAGTGTAITSFWASSGMTPGSHYTAGAANIAAFNDSHTMMMLIMIVSGLGMASIALRNRFSFG